MPQTFWTLNGSPDFGLIPPGIANQADTTPIRLQRGTAQWGHTHILQRHGTFVRRNSVGAPLDHEVPWLLWKKLQNSGTIYEDGTQRKCTLFIPLSPSSLLVLRLDPTAAFFGVTTLYGLGHGVQDTAVGRYVGVRWPPRQPPPTFYLPP